LAWYVPGHISESRGGLLPWSFSTVEKTLSKTGPPKLVFTKKPSPSDVLSSCEQVPEQQRRRKKTVRSLMSLAKHNEFKASRVPLKMVQDFLYKL